MKLKYESAITLIALMITVIILLILAGITISLTVGHNGILEKAQQANIENKKSEIQETIQLAIMDIEAEIVSNQKGESLNGNILIQKLPDKLPGIMIQDDMTGTYQGYEYYIDENYNVHIGNAKQVTNHIKMQETKRMITVSVIDIEEGIKTIEVINPKGETVASKECDGIVTQDTVECIANLSGEYRTKVTTSNNTIEEKTMMVKNMEISNLAELKEFAEMIENGITFEDDTVYVVDDIDLGGNESNRNWKAIGDLTENKYFAGTLEGNNHKISNLYNTQINEPRQGLFSYINGGTIQNLGIESGNVIAKYTGGGFVGRIDNGNIINCYNKAKVESKDLEGAGGTGALGGIVGVTNDTTIENCYNEGEIKGKLSEMGGIVGQTHKTKVQKCYNLGNVTSESGGFVGGIVGAMVDESIVINCYNKGEITANATAGGLVGWDETGTEIRNSYSLGKVTAQSNAGGVIGIHSGILSNLFFIKTAGPYYGCGTNDTEFGLEESNGSTEETLKQLTNKLNGTQNQAPWKEDTEMMNGGYPILTWQVK